MIKRTSLAPPSRPFAPSDSLLTMKSDHLFPLLIIAVSITPLVAVVSNEPKMTSPARLMRKLLAREPFARRFLLCAGDFCRCRHRSRLEGRKNHLEHPVFLILPSSACDCVFSSVDDVQGRICCRARRHHQPLLLMSFFCLLCSN